MGWIPTPSGEPRTKLPPLPIDLMLDKEVLKEFVHRNSIIGKWLYGNPYLTVAFVYLSNYTQQGPVNVL